MSLWIYDLVDDQKSLFTVYAGASGTIIKKKTI